MHIRLYQIDLDRDADRVAFTPLRYMTHVSGGVDMDIYDRVYEGDVPAGSLEGVFSRLNNGTLPYVGRSMSVSDVVQVISGGSVDPGYYFCDSCGFKQLEMVGAAEEVQEDD